MKSPASKFLFLVFMLTLVCVALQWGWNNNAPEKMRMYNGYWLLGIFAVTVSVVHLLLLNSGKASGSAFIRAFMLASTLKFFFYLSVLAIFIVCANDNKLAVGLHFLAYYFIFNILEVSMLYKEIRKKQPILN